MKQTICDVCGLHANRPGGTLWWVDEPDYNPADYSLVYSPIEIKRSKDLCHTCLKNILHYMETLKP